MLSQELNDAWVYEGIIADRHLQDIEVNIMEIQKNWKEIAINKSFSVKNI